MALATPPLLQSKKRFKHLNTTINTEAENPLTKPSKMEPFVLHVVATPIGNIKDLTLRALEVLQQADYIVCANRHSSQVFLSLIDTDSAGRLLLYNGRENSRLIELLRGGSTMAFLVPSGTPCVGDVGNSLVSDMIKSGIRVTPVPGACSITTALSVSGMTREDGDGSFFFGGFVSPFRFQRMRQLEAAKKAQCPSIFFTMPRRLIDTLADVAAMMPNRKICVQHELTKYCESTHIDTAEKLRQFYSLGCSINLVSKGQLMITIEGAPLEQRWPGAVPPRVLYNEVSRLLANSSECSLKTAFALVAEKFRFSESYVATAFHRFKNEKCGSEQLMSDSIAIAAGVEGDKNSSSSVLEKEENTNAILSDNNEQPGVALHSDVEAVKSMSGRRKKKRLMMLRKRKRIGAFERRRMILARRIALKEEKIRMMKEQEDNSLP